MAQQLLNGSQICSTVKQMSSSRMPKGMRAKCLPARSLQVGGNKVIDLANSDAASPLAKKHSLPAFRA